MAKSKQAVARQLEELKRLYPAPRHYLDFKNPFQLLVATILSAQCTDEKVNEVTSALFEKYPGPEGLAAEAIERIEDAVRPTGFYRNKAKAIKGASEMIVKEHGGEVPGSMEELVKLPGIARKSANAILQHGFNRVVGIVVDTHVARVSKRLGWTLEKDRARSDGPLRRGRVEMDPILLEEPWEIGLQGAHAQVLRVRDRFALPIRLDRTIESEETQEEALNPQIP